MKNEEEGVYTRENSRTCKTISAFILEKKNPFKTTSKKIFLPISK
jgi:hypothetical protein